MLSSSFGCEQININHSYYFGHSLLCYLSQTQMFNKLASEASLLNKNSCLKCEQIHNRHMIRFNYAILCYLGQTQMLNRPKLRLVYQTKTYSKLLFTCEQINIITAINSGTVCGATQVRLRCSATQSLWPVCLTKAHAQLKLQV